MTAMIALIDEASGWLRTRDTDQWERPWPNRAGRDSRIRAALRRGRSWICWDDDMPAATITADPDGDPYWSAEDRAEPAVYLHRLVVGRNYAGAGLGAALIDWAGWTARRDHRARWIRVSAWTTNLRLHRYYEHLGFVPRGFHPDDGYPSAARFQKATADIPPVEFKLFELA